MELSEIDCWKATDFPSFMLYWKPLVLKDSFPCKIYDNMLFSVGMYLWLSPGISEEGLAFAHKLMVSCEEYIGVLYGKDEIVYNVHQLDLVCLAGLPFKMHLELLFCD